MRKVVYRLKWEKEVRNNAVFVLPYLFFFDQIVYTVYQKYAWGRFSVAHSFCVTRG